MDYAFDLHDGLMLARIGDQRLVIDTGAPASVARTAITVDGSTFDVDDMFLGYSIDWFADKLGTGIDGLLGCDVLNNYWFRIDYPAGLITFDSTPMPVTGNAIPMREMTGMAYIVEVACAGRVQQSFLDTGASVSYLQPADDAPCERLGRFDDFNPLFGDFSTDLYHCEVTLGDTSFMARCGQLPDSATALMEMVGVSGILGVDLFRACRATFAPQQGQLFLESLR